MLHQPVESQERRGYTESVSLRPSLERLGLLTPVGFGIGFDDREITAIYIVLYSLSLVLSQDLAHPLDDIFGSFYSIEVFFQLFLVVYQGSISVHDFVSQVFDSA
jgi:hypothetical protein